MGLLDLIGPIGGSVISGVGGMLGNLAGARESAKNRQFQEYMSSTAHQREVEDLRKAGLNPILSASHGGASTPSGSTASQQNPFSGAGEQIHKAGLTRAQTELSKMDKEARQWDINNAKWDIELKNANIMLTNAKKLTELQTFENLKQDFLHKEYVGKKGEVGTDIIDAGRKLLGQAQQLEPGVIYEGLKDEIKNYGSKAKDWFGKLFDRSWFGGPGSTYQNPSDTYRKGKGVVNGGQNKAEPPKIERDEYGVPKDPEVRKREWDKAYKKGYFPSH